MVRLVRSLASDSLCMPTSFYFAIARIVTPVIAIVAAINLRKTFFLSFKIKNSNTITKKIMVLFMASTLPTSPPCEYERRVKALKAVPKIAVKSIDK